MYDWPDSHRLDQNHELKSIIIFNFYVYSHPVWWVPRHIDCLFRCTWFCPENGNGENCCSYIIIFILIYYWHSFYLDIFSLYFALRKFVNGHTSAGSVGSGFLNVMLMQVWHICWYQVCCISACILCILL